MLSELIATVLCPPLAWQAPCMPLHERVRADPPAPGVCACTMRDIKRAGTSTAQAAHCGLLARTHAFLNWAL